MVIIQASRKKGKEKKKKRESERKRGRENQEVILKVQEVQTSQGARDDGEMRQVRPFDVE